MAPIPRDRLASHVRAVDAGEFGRFVAAVLTAGGWRTTLAEDGNDLGIDMIANRDEDAEVPDPFGPEEDGRLLVRVEPELDAVVDETLVRRYGGIATNSDPVAGFVIATRGEVDDGAATLAAEGPVECLDPEALADLVAHYGLTEILDRYVDEDLAEGAAGETASAADDEGAADAGPIEEDAPGDGAVVLEDATAGAGGGDAPEDADDEPATGWSAPDEVVDETASGPDEVWAGAGGDADDQGDDDGTADDDVAAVDDDGTADDDGAVDDEAIDDDGAAAAPGSEATANGEDATPRAGGPTSGGENDDPARATGNGDPNPAAGDDPASAVENHGEAPAAENDDPAPAEGASGTAASEGSPAPGEGSPSPDRDPGGGDDPPSDEWSTPGPSPEEGTAAEEDSTAGGDAGTGPRSGTGPAGDPASTEETGSPGDTAGAPDDRDRTPETETEPEPEPEPEAGADVDPGRATPAGGATDEPAGEAGGPDADAGGAPAEAGGRVADAGATSAEVDGGPTTADPSTVEDQGEDASPAGSDTGADADPPASGGAAAGTADDPTADGLATADPATGEAVGGGVDRGDATDGPDTPAESDAAPGVDADDVADADDGDPAGEPVGEGTGPPGDGAGDDPEGEPVDLPTMFSGVRRYAPTGDLADVDGETKSEVVNHLVSRAPGDPVTETALLKTVDRLGLFDAPLADYLVRGELPAFLIKDSTRPVRVGEDDTVAEPDDDGTTFHLITNARILSVVGRADGDVALSIPIEAVDAVEFHEATFRAELRVTVGDEVYRLPVRHGSELVVETAIDYVREGPHPRVESPLDDRDPF